MFKIIYENIHNVKTMYYFFLNMVYQCLCDRLNDVDKQKNIETVPGKCHLHISGRDCVDKGESQPVS